MNKDDIIRMAHEAGIEYSKNLNQIVSPYCDGVHMDELEKFINIVAAAERQACAQIAHDTYEGFGVDAKGVDFVKQRIIDQIRARGQE